MKPTRFDVILVALLIVAALAVVGFSHVSRASRTPAEASAGRFPIALISIDGVEYTRLPLEEDTTVTLPTAHTVQVKGGEVSITSAPCPDRVCAQTAPARSVGDCIICLPERVVITVTEDVAT